MRDMQQDLLLTWKHDETHGIQALPSCSFDCASHLDPRDSFSFRPEQRSVNLSTNRMGRFELWAQHRPETCQNCVVGLPMDMVLRTRPLRVCVCVSE